jgi:glucose dehydrogenase
MHIRSFALFAASWLFAAIAWAQSPHSIDDATLKNAGRTGQDWISYNAGWDEQRYSPLDQINASNVSRLGLAWYADIPSAPGRPQTHQEATPLEHDGVIYSIAPWSVVYAVDARSGKELWRSDPEVNQEVWQSRICCGVVNRGIALYKDMVIAPVIDGRMRALDTKTGRIVWETRVAPSDRPYSFTMAPRVIKGGLEVLYRPRRSFQTLRAAGTRRSRQNLERRLVEAGRRRAGVGQRGL